MLGMRMRRDYSPPEQVLVQDGRQGCLKGERLNVIEAVDEGGELAWVTEFDAGQVKLEPLLQAHRRSHEDKIKQ